MIVRGLGRLELGLTQQKRQVLDVNTLLAPLMKLLRNEIPPGTTVHWFPCENPLPVMGHLALLNTAFSGIIDNAREAVTAPGGTISITTAQFDGIAHISVVNTTASDTGENLMRAFEPFYSTKNPEAHCGLGLTLAERFIASHNGNIALQLRSTTEVCATITLPLTTEPLLE
jgi:signal transduction histidine kinase